MIKRTLYFGNPAYLSTKNAQLVVSIPAVDDLDETSKQNTIPIEDIGIIVLDNKQITITHGALEVLLENNSAVITCDSSHLPVGLFLPLCGNSTQNERFRAQLDSSQPLKKQLWQQTIQSKIKNQAAILKQCRCAENRNMLRWAEDVRSGDPDNIEARAAVYYWQKMFDDFLRDREGEAPNNLLNYGYAILRAVVARALVVSGMLPTLGIHHHNRYNAYCLADDIMEPYRPYVDKLVFEMFASGTVDLDKNAKIKLLSIPVLDVMINNQRSPLMLAVGTTTASLYKCFSGENRKIIYPEM